MNIPGIQSIEYIPSSNLSLPSFLSGEIDIAPYLNGDFTKLDISPGAGPLKGDNKETSAGNYLAVTLPFAIADVTPENDQLLHLLSRRPHAFRIKDVSGRTFLIGAQGIKVEVDFTLETGKAGKGLRGYNCKLTTKALNGLLFLK